MVEPSTYLEAINDRENSTKWKEAMKEEMESLMSNNTFSLVQPPLGKKVLKNKWVYKIKRNEDHTPSRFKARQVIKGYLQEDGLDYEETFAPVVKILELCNIFWNK